MPQQSRPIDRSGISILSFQIQGLCNALRIAVQSGQPVGPVSGALFVKLRNDTLSVVSGRCVEGLPEMDGSASPVDLLTYTEILNETLNAFLSPEEGEEKRRFFGFDQFAIGVGPLSLGLGRQQRT
jgi:hypothetical protein